MRRAWPLVLLLLLPGMALAQEVSEAYGTVVDRDGQPIQGVTVRFHPQGSDQPEYSGKTSKKGKYFVSGMWTPNPEYRWVVEVDFAEHVPVKLEVESRNVNNVLVGDVMTTELRSNSKLPDFVIRPLGKARVDLTLAPLEAQLAAERAAAPAAPAATSGEAAGAAAAAPAAPKADPWSEALATAKSGNYEEAAPLFAEAVKQQPDDAERHETYAKILYELERHDDAVREAERAIELEPRRLDARKLLASVALDREDLPRARQTLEEAIAVAPADVGLYERLAYVASRGERPDDAIAAYEKITEIAPDNVGAWAALGGLYAGQGRAADSERAYRKVVELDPSSSYQTFYNLGVLIMNRNDRSDADTRRAIDAFRKAIEIKPDYAQALQQLGFALLGVGDQVGAVEALQAYLKASPRAPDAERMRGLIQTLSK